MDFALIIIILFQRIRTYKSEYIENITQSAKLANEIVKFIEKTNGPRMFIFRTLRRKEYDHLY